MRAFDFGLFDEHDAVKAKTAAEAAARTNLLAKVYAEAIEKLAQLKKTKKKHEEELHDEREIMWKKDEVSQLTSGIDAMTGQIERCERVMAEYEESQAAARWMGMRTEQPCGHCKGWCAKLRKCPLCYFGDNHSAANAVSYCSRACQIEGYPAHKALCTRLRKQQKKAGKGVEVEARKKGKSTAPHADGGGGGDDTRAASRRAAAAAGDEEEEDAAEEREEEREEEAEEGEEKEPVFNVLDRRDGSTGLGEIEVGAVCTSWNPVVTRSFEETTCLKPPGFNPRT
jgi:hypothetical protein